MNSENLFNLIKNKKIDLFKKTLEKNKEKINLDIKDKYGNYLINYIINLNNKSILEFILKKYNLRLDVRDAENKNLLYIPIKYNYYDILEIILKYNKKSIGINILDRKDDLGYTGLHYCLIFNNFEALKLLLNNNADIYINTDNNENIFEIGFNYERTDMLLYIIKNMENYNYKNFDGQTIIQMALGYENIEIVNFLIDKDIDLNNSDKEHGYCLLHLIVALNYIELFNNIIKKNININQVDFIGYNALHFSIKENNYYITKKLMEYDIDYNISNNEGNIPLHTFLENNENISNDINTDEKLTFILKQLIKKSNLNIQNNYGDTCLHLLVDTYLWDNEIIIDILKNKKLNIFIENNNNETVYSKILNKDKLLKFVSESYYYIIQKNKKKLKLDWEKKCADQDYKKIKNTDNKKKCIKKILDIMKTKKKSLPKILDYNITIENGIFVNTCYYIGIPIDILFGLIYLKDKYPSTGLVLDYPLTINNELNNYYKDLGIDFEFKLQFSNVNITWSYQKLIYPTFFNEWFKNYKKKYKYIIIPIGIELYDKSHANILFYDIDKKTVERFEPNGANVPIGLNYNPNLLDKLIENKFQQIDQDIKYIRPQDYLPEIGFQMYESFEREKCKRLGDPNGFCGVWCTWWIDQKLKYNNIESSILAKELIKEIKLNNIEFKTIIRNYTKNITTLRDNYFNKYNLDINKFYNNNFDNELLNKLEKDIIQLF
jgi:ankyrin repeat protein